MIPGRDTSGTTAFCEFRTTWPAQTDLATSPYTGVINKGTLSGSTDLIAKGGGSITIINTGTIIGRIKVRP